MESQASPRRRTVADPEAERSALQRVGLAMRAGRLVLGTNAVREAARRGAIAGALMATDVTDNTWNRLVPLLTGLGVPVVRCGTVVELGRAVGKERLAIIGIADSAFAGQLMANLPVEESNRHGVITEEDGSWGI